MSKSGNSSSAVSEYWRSIIFALYLHKGGTRTSAGFVEVRVKFGTRVKFGARVKFGTRKRLIKVNLSTKFGRIPINIHGVRTD